MIGLSKTELTAAEVIIAWRSTHSSLRQRKSGTWRRGAVTMDAGKEGRASMYARYDQTGTCVPLLILSKRWETIVMESCVTRECHAQFGERDRETRLSRGRKVRSVPTPLSPLLMNVALHGMETAIREAKYQGGKPIVIRYADDFVVLHPIKDELQKAATLVTEWLKSMGLWLSPNKTKVTHTLTPYEGRVGFDFLGYTIRQFPVGKTHTGKSTHGKPLGFKTFIKPSKETIKRHTQQIGQVLRKQRNAPQERVIRDFNPVIRGWCLYHRWVICTEAFNTCDHIRGRARIRAKIYHSAVAPLLKPIQIISR